MSDGNSKGSKNSEGPTVPCVNEQEWGPWAGWSLRVDETPRAEHRLRRIRQQGREVSKIPRSGIPGLYVCLAFFKALTHMTFITSVHSYTAHSTFNWRLLGIITVHSGRA